ncbi:hypothetical protein AVEN_198212-1 [Araneus ventricosus]|uniref:Uncharacterized protein n=1 Tax=Araneus ventricosus TaxID=182803 RepID=A0A4Y2E7Z9_ARAVE|nr:hypothetical protein AVEN_198212-1 [Araneus ventricosus]
MEAPEFFEVRPTPDPEQYQEDEALQGLLIDLEPEVQEERVPQDLQGDLEPEMEEEQEVLQAMREGLEPEVEHQEILQAVQGGPGPEVEEEKDVYQAVQEGPEPDVKEQDGILQALPGQVHLEINRMVHPEEVPQEYEAPVARIHLRQHIEPNIQQELVHLTNILQENEVHLNIVPMASDLLRPSWEGARREIIQQIMYLNIVPMASELLRPSWEGARREIIQQIMYLNIVPMASELLRPSWKEARSEILQQIMSFNTEQVRFRVANITDAMDITRQEFTTSFYSQEGPPRLLALEGPPRLLALEGPPRLLALEGPPRLLALEGCWFSYVLLILHGANYVT